MTIKTFHLDTEQDRIARQIIEENKRNIGRFHCEESTNMLEDWIVDAYANDELEYHKFLQDAFKAKATIYTLFDDWQPIGEVVVY